MKETAAAIFNNHPTRFTTKEKRAFLQTAQEYFTELGYGENEIKLMKNGNNLNFAVGDVKSTEYIITAHYDTPGNNGWMLFTAPLIGQTGANILSILVCLPLLALEIVFDIIAERLDLSLLATELFILSPMMLLLAMILIKNKTNRNDNTSGVLAVMRIAQLVAANSKLRSKCCFVLFDNEEWGLLGSSAFASQCTKEKINLKGKLVINLDCVGVGDTLVAATTGKPSAKAQKLIDSLNANGTELCHVVSRLIYMSDHANFKSSLMLCYMKKSKLGPLYIPNIHCAKDTECDLALVDGLAQSVVKSIGTI